MTLLNIKKKDVDSDGPTSENLTTRVKTRNRFILYYDSTADEIDDSQPVRENNSNSYAEEVPLCGMTFLKYLANPVTFQSEIAEAVSKVCSGDFNELDHSLRYFLLGGLVRDSTKLGNNKSMPKILSDDIEYDVFFSRDKTNEKASHNICNNYENCN